MCRIIERGDAASGLFAHFQRLTSPLVLGQHSSRPVAPRPACRSVIRYAAFFSPTDVLIVPAAAARRANVVTRGARASSELQATPSGMRRHLERVASG
jgi:hypothetical protein